MKYNKITEDSYWFEVEKALEENTVNGFKMACIEAEKNFRAIIKRKGYPTDNLEHTLTIFGWKLTDKEGLRDAIKRVDEIKNTFEYRLSSFEAEDIVEVFKQAIADLDELKPLNWQKKMALFVDHYFSFKGSFLKNLTILALVFLLAVKILAYTSFGKAIVGLSVKAADVVYSWFLIFLVLLIGVFIFVIAFFASMDGRKTKIKSIKEK